MHLQSWQHNWPKKPKHNETSWRKCATWSTPQLASWPPCVQSLCYRLCVFGFVLIITFATCMWSYLPAYRHELLTPSQYPNGLPHQLVVRGVQIQKWFCTCTCTACTLGRGCGSSQKGCGFRGTLIKRIEELAVKNYGKSDLFNWIKQSRDWR